MQNPIKSEALLESAKCYSYQTLHRLGITPSDIDAVYERDGRFLFFEFKCDVVRDASMKSGQRRLWQALLRALGNNALMILCEHGDVSDGVVDPLAAMNSFRAYYWDGAEMKKTAKISPDGGSLEWLVNIWTGRKETELKNWLAGFVEN